MDAESAAAAAAAQLAASGVSQGRKDTAGGRFDFDDGGTYCGGWEEGKAHGHGVCTGPKGQGEYRGSWHFGFEVSGVYTWPSGSYYEGHWQNGKRHGLGTEYRGKWLYRGEWTQGFKGRYGARQAVVSNAKYEGTWANGLQDGYGSETYADTGTYQGQWLRGLRHGYGVRTSAPFGMASHNRLLETRNASMASLNQDAAIDPLTTSPSTAAGLEEVAGEETASARAISRRGEEARGGFVLRAKSDEMPHRRRSLVERTGMKSIVQGLKLKKQRSTGDLDRKGVTSIRSTGSTTSWMSSESGFTTGASVMSEGSNQSFAIEDEQLDASVTETYMGEWKNDKRCGFGISERSDGLKYEGEWYNNRKYGYGVTTFRGVREEGKYKNNVLVTSNQKRHLFLIRSAKFRERIDSALNAAQRASKIALQKADIAISRTATARGKAEQAEIAAVHARDDAQLAVNCAKLFGGDPATLDQPLPSMETNVMASMASKPIANNILSVNVNANSMANNRPRTPEVVIQPPASVPPALSKSNVSVQPQKPSPISAQVQQPRAAPPSPAVAPPPAAAPPPSQPMSSNLNSNNVMQRPSVSSMMRSVQSSQATPSNIGGGMASAVTMASPTTNCDISNTTDNAMLQKRSTMPNHQPPAAPQQPQRLMAQQQPQQPPQQRGPSPSMRQPMSSGFPQQDPMGRPSLHQNRQPSFDMGGPGGATGGYNFQRIMDDHFEHYKRAPSRERSVDKTNLPASLAEAPAGGLHTRGRSGSRPPLLRNAANNPEITQPPPARPPSRGTSGTRAPSASRAVPGGQQPLPYTDMDLDLRRAELEAKFAQNGEAAHEDMSIRHRGQPSQVVAELGTIPKRTESLYVKQSLESKGKDTPAGTLQRKKSLPDVKCLDVTTQAQGSKAMTREEISVLSSARREAVRRQLEEIEAYKNNPFLYILNPRVKEWISRQKLMLFILFINLSLAIMFFKLLT